jgi:hypothetical protein
MDIFHQSKNSLAFKTHVSEGGQLSSQKWRLSLQNGPEGLSGILVSDFWTGNRGITLTFRRMGSM